MNEELYQRIVKAADDGRTLTAACKEHKVKPTTFFSYRQRKLGKKPSAKSPKLTKAARQLFGGAELKRLKSRVAFLEGILRPMLGHLALTGLENGHFQLGELRGEEWHVRNLSK